MQFYLAFLLGCFLQTLPLSLTIFPLGFNYIVPTVWGVLIAILTWRPEKKPWTRSKIGLPVHCDVIPPKRFYVSGVLNTPLLKASSFEVTLRSEIQRLILKPMGVVNVGRIEQVKKITPGAKSFDFGVA